MILSNKQSVIDPFLGVWNNQFGAEKATLYKKVFGDCCDVPQSGCNCVQPSNPA